MKKEENKPLILNKIMSSKDYLNRTKSKALNNITLIHLSNKIKDTLNPLKKKVKKYSKRINRRIKNILNTSNVIDKAKLKSSFLKDILYELDLDHKNNMSNFKTIRQTTNDLKHVYMNIKHIEKEEREKNEKEGNDIDKNISNIIEQPKIESQNFELSRDKIHNLLSDNILLMVKKREIYAYYLIRNKFHKFNDEKKIRYINKIRELLEIKHIEANQLMDEKEKKAKIENNRYFINRKKRLKKEKLENYNKMVEKINQENEISLRSIKETNATLNTIRKNKSYLDEDIKLKFDHNYSQPSYKNNINIPNINQKKILIKNISSKYSNRSDKNKAEHNDSSIGNISNISNMSNLDFLKSSRIKRYFDLIESNQKDKNMSNKSLINLKRFMETKKTVLIPKNVIKAQPDKIKNLGEQVMPDNNVTNIYDDEKKVKSRLNSVYEEIKVNNVLKKKDEDYIRNYFLRKKARLTKKPSQAVTIMSNSLSRINQVDITKKLKRIHGLHVPEKYSKIFDNLEYIDNTANNMKGNIYDSICKVKMDN